MTSDKGTAILLVQIGSPSSADVAKVREYQRNFLSDPLVVFPPPPFWKQITEWFILPRRAPRTAKNYEALLNASEGGEMPLLRNTRKLAERTGFSHCFLYAGEPSPKTALKELAARGYKRIAVFPLHPQRGGATVDAALQQVKNASEELRAESGAAEPAPELILFDKGFASEDFYINALAESIKKTRDEAIIKPTEIVFSFHGFPKKRIELGDKYLYDCESTARLICTKLLFNSKGHLAFQSKFGSGKWLGPSVKEVVKKLAKKNAAIMVICPGFVSENLETIIEIDRDLRAYFESEGGHFWNRVPCLNLDDAWIEGLSRYCGQLKL